MNKNRIRRKGSFRRFAKQLLCRTGAAAFLCTGLLPTAAMAQEPEAGCEVLQAFETEDRDGQPAAIIHHHDANCFDEDGTQWCPLEEIQEHVHSADCFSTRQDGGDVPVCGLDEVIPHSHSPECLDENGICICQKQEVLVHQHDAGCIPKPESTPEPPGEQPSVPEGGSEAGQKPAEADPEPGMDEAKESPAGTPDQDAAPAQEEAAKPDEGQSASKMLQPDLVFDGEKIFAALQGPVPEGSVLEAQIVQQITDESLNQIVFVLSLQQQERTVDAAGPVGVEIVLKEAGNSARAETFRLLQRVSPKQREWVNAWFVQDENGLHIRFACENPGEFVLYIRSDEELADAANAGGDPSQTEAFDAQAAGGLLQLYDSTGQMVLNQQMVPGQSIVLPFDPIGHQPNGSRFLGWSTSNAYISNGEAWKYNPLYPPGSTLIWSDAFLEKPLRLYPVFAIRGTNTWADFFIRLDGQIPNEPSSNPPGMYTWKVPIMGGLEWVAPFTDSTGIQVGNGGRIAKEPDAAQLADVINPKADAIGYGAKAIDGVLYKTMKIAGKDSLVNAKGEPVAWSGSGEVPASAVRLSVLWYVIKKEGPNWHVDGVLLESSQVSLMYSIGSAGMGEVSGMPDGLSMAPGSVVYAGHTLNNPAAAPSIPRRAGYEFLGWQDPESGVLYDSSQTFVIEKDTVLQALWKPASGNSLIVYKTDEDGKTMLKDAVFDLEGKTGDGTWKIEAAGLRTQADGTLVYDGLRTETIYRLRETAPPFGYKPCEAVCFRIVNKEGVLDAYICDEQGNPAGAPGCSLDVFGSEDSLMLSLRLVNIPYTAPFSLRKSDGAHPLAGAQVQIARSTDGWKTEISKGTTGADGMAVFEKSGSPQILLKDGVYEIREISPPDGYSLFSETIRLKVEQGKISLTGSSQMAELHLEKDGWVLELKNAKGIELPDTGQGGRDWMQQAAMLSACAGLCLMAAGMIRKKGNES